MKERKEQPNYYAIIPASVRYDKRLKANAKLMYGEITALSNKEGYCWASNNYFADLYDVKKRAVQIWIEELIECGYITTQLIYSDKNMSERRIFLTDANTHVKKDTTPVSKKTSKYYKVNTAGRALNTFTGVNFSKSEKFTASHNIEPVEKDFTVKKEEVDTDTEKIPCQIFPRTKNLVCDFPEPIEKDFTVKKEVETSSYSTVPNEVPSVLNDTYQFSRAPRLNKLGRDCSYAELFEIDRSIKASDFLSGKYKEVMF